MFAVSHPNDGRSGNGSDALRHNVEQALQNADIRRDHQTNGDSRIDVTAADVTD